MVVWKIYRLPQTFAGFRFAGIRDEAILAPPIGWPNVNEACYRNHDISASCILHQRELQGSVEQKGICGAKRDMYVYGKWNPLQLYITIHLVCSLNCLVLK